MENNENLEQNTNNEINNIAQTPAEPVVEQTPAEPVVEQTPAEPVTEQAPTGNNEQMINGVPMQEIIDPLSTTLSEVDKPAETPAPAPVEKKNNNTIAIVVIIVCVVLGVLFVIKPWNKKETKEPTNTYVNSNDTEEQPADFFDLDNAVEGEIVE